jgi:hypothetical protein
MALLYWPIWLVLVAGAGAGCVVAGAAGDLTMGVVAIILLAILAACPPWE